MEDQDNQMTTHAETNFDPEEYLDLFDTHFTGKRIEDGLRIFAINQLHEIYKDGKITGDRLLDLGTGPCNYSIFAASKWFREIILSDISEPNLAVLRDWKAGKRHLQEAVFKYMLKLEGSQEDWVACSSRLANQVRSIVRADLRCDRVLKDTEVEGIQFDAINLILSQSVASMTLAGHKKVVENYSRLLKPGGHLIMVDSVDAPYYQVGSNRFKLCDITNDQLRSTIEECGYEKLYWKQEDINDELSRKCDFIAMVARKK